ncbi:MAG: large subunit ribosomal protein [Methanolobus sp.]|uniref:Large ribosomal subunit protein uL10 n=1 Tax=Methanolobus tindarius DSM 2278 TaxID=1090322 RepID=W9DRF7_METTI|nr:MULTISPECIES: 50S ribosomal protein L10 [Methanolobus]ETA68308.1 ribosomal protein L10 [Methanolobus tindarius DSM 2278]MDK2831890.1 large subunit ribosomal protein [Methanolobus sp.]
MAEEHHTTHIPQWKKDEVEAIKELIKEYPIFGVIGIGGIPAKQLQKMRRDLKGKAVLKVARNTLIRRALDESSEVKDMEEYVDVQTALVFTEQNPFKLFKTLEKSKSPSPIKAGAIAPRDIIVEKGPTSFPPGPILGDMQAAGIPAAIDGGKVVIRETKAVAKEGEAVSQKLAAMLTRLEIYPMEVGLDLRAAFENGMIFTPDVLAIDEDKYFSDIVLAAQQAFNTSVFAAYPTEENIKTLIAKATTESRNLGVNAVVLEPGIVDVLLGKAQSEMLSVASIASANNEEAVDDELKEALGAAASAAAAAPAETVEEEEKEEEQEEESSEEDGMAGLGALFG